MFIGRDPKSEITLTDSQVSWRHACITTSADACELEDLNSTNGTYVGRKRINRIRLRPGDTITIRPYRLTYSANQDAPSATTASEQTLSAAILGRLPGTNIFRNIRDFSEAQTIDGLVILRIDASLYFANSEFLKAKTHEILQQHGDTLKAIILDASAVNDLDSSADTALHQISADFKRRDVAIYIAGVKGPVRKVMRRSGLYDVLGGDHFFFTIDAAVKRYLRTVATQSRKLSPDDTAT